MYCKGKGKAKFAICFDTDRYLRKQEILRHEANHVVTKISVICRLYIFKLDRRSYVIIKLFITELII